MWRTVFLLGAMTLPGAPPGPTPEALTRFHDHYGIFFRKYFGCPPEALKPEECLPGQGIVDLRELKASCEAAKDLFALEGSCH